MPVRFDPPNDTFGFSSPQLDIEQISATVTDGNLILGIDFFTSIAPPSSFLPEAVVGYVDVDLDQDSLTGSTSNQSIFAPPRQQGGALGAEITINLFSEQFNSGFVELIRPFDGTVIGQAPITYGFDFLSIQIPLELLENDDAFNLSAIIGTSLEPTDAAPDTEVLVIEAIDNLEVEPNDTIATAIDTGLVANTTGSFATTAQIGNNSAISANLDVDFYQVELDAGDQLTLDIDAVVLGSPLDSVLRVFDSSGNELAVNDDFNGLDSFIEFSTSVTGTYYVGVSGFANFSYNPFVEGSGTVASIGNYVINIDVVSPIEFIGTDEDDFLIGTGGVDLLSGLDGDDTVLALAGNDRLLGGDGDDLLNGGEGNDSVSGEDGADQLTGNGGNDSLSGGDGIDVIDGGDGDDAIAGDRGRDRISGEAGDDRIDGGEDNDIIDAGEGFDTVFGGDDNDRLFGGTDSDQLFGDAGDDQIYGGLGFDVLEGGDGRDTLYGGIEDDFLGGGNGRDFLEAGQGFDSLDGGEGEDVLIGVDLQSPFSTLGTGEQDTLLGGADDDRFILGTEAGVFYDDGNSFSTGEFDYASIVDFDRNQDEIQLSGSAEFYNLDLFTSSAGTIDAALIYDPGVAARGEVIAILQNVDVGLTIADSAFVFV